MKNMMAIFVIFVPVFLFVHASCTNLQLDILDERIQDNFHGNLYQPTDIDPPGVNAFSFAVMGDTHVGSPGGGIITPMVAKALSGGDSFIVVTGDLTNTGKDGQYRVFKNVMETGGFPGLWRVAIGNHDVFFNGWHDYRTEIGKSIYSFDADNVHFSILDSASGILGQAQLEWLENDLRSTSQPLKVVVTHFPVFDGYFGGLFRLDSDEEIAILKTLLYKYNVNLMFSGHYHGYESIVLGRTRYIVTGGANDLQDIGEFQHFVRVTVNGNSISTQVVNFP